MPFTCHHAALLKANRTRPEIESWYAHEHEMTRTAFQTCCAIQIFQIIGSPQMKQKFAPSYTPTVTWTTVIVWRVLTARIVQPKMF